MCLLTLGAREATAQTDELTFNLRDETAPAGSLVQLKLEETVVTPISGGRPRMSFGPGLTVAGIAIPADGGELAGAAVVDGKSLAITYVSTAPGAGGEYPVLTVSFRLAPDLPVGTEVEVTLEPSLWHINGVSFPSREATATVTVGGTLAVTNVVPGEGFFPEGTVVTVHGQGFVPDDTRVRLDGDRLRDAEVTPTEIRFALPESMNLAGAELRIDAASERVFYYSYLRGTPAATSRRPLLSKIVPIFSGVTRSEATFGPIFALRAPRDEYAALALQNPNLDPADVTLDVLAADGTLVESSAHSLAAGHRLVLEVSELFDGVRPVRPPRGGSVRVASSLPIEAFGLIVDERTGTVTPHLMTGSAEPFVSATPPHGARAGGDGQTGQ